MNTEITKNTADTTNNCTELPDYCKIAYNILADEELVKKCTDKATESISHIRTPNVPDSHSAYQTATTEKPATLRKTRTLTAMLIISILLLIVACSASYMIATAPIKSNNSDLALAASVIDEGYVNTSKLGVHITNFTYVDELYITSFNCNYYECTLDTDAFLKYCKGDLIEELSSTTYSHEDMVIDGSTYSEEYNYYKLAGHDDMAYIIMEYYDDYYLLKYAFAENFAYAPYPYHYVLEYVYDIDSADDIASLVITNYSSETVIGNTNEISNRETIEYIYDVIAGLSCYEPDNWLMIEDVDSIPSNLAHTAYNISVVTSKGEIIDLLQFDNAYNGFYGNEGTPFDELDRDTLEIFRNFATVDTVTYTPVESNWDVNINASNVTSTGLYLTVSQCGEDHVDQLYIYDEFYIEMRDGYIWQPLDYITEDIGFDYESELIPADYNMVESVEINWDYMYGELPSGTYRICNYICCEDETVTNPYNSYWYYTEFKILEQYP